MQTVHYERGYHLFKHYIQGTKPAVLHMKCLLLEGVISNALYIIDNIALYLFLVMNKLVMGPCAGICFMLAEHKHSEISLDNWKFI